MLEQTHDALRSSLPNDMLIRTVRLTLRPEAVDEFQEYFDAAAPEIRAFPGCRHLELWQGERFPNILTTCSRWQSSAALERYRRSTLFRTIWTRVKPLFAAPPAAHSYAPLRTVAAEG